MFTDGYHLSFAFYLWSDAYDLNYIFLHVEMQFLLLIEIYE